MLQRLGVGRGPFPSSARMRQTLPSKQIPDAARSGPVNLGCMPFEIGTQLPRPPARMLTRFLCRFVGTHKKTPSDKSDQDRYVEIDQRMLLT
jgi:hypothetical protein